MEKQIYCIFAFFCDFIMKKIDKTKSADTIMIAANDIP